MFGWHSGKRLAGESQQKENPNTREVTRRTREMARCFCCLGSLCPITNNRLCGSVHRFPSCLGQAFQLRTVLMQCSYYMKWIAQFTYGVICASHAAGYINWEGNTIRVPLRFRLKLYRCRKGDSFGRFAMATLILLIFSVLPQNVTAAGNFG